MSKYDFKQGELLQAYCERIASYWSTLNSMQSWASGKAMSQRYKTARAFQTTIRLQGFTDTQAHQMYHDVLEMARLIANSESEKSKTLCEILSDKKTKR